MRETGEGERVEGNIPRPLVAAAHSPRALVNGKGHGHRLEVIAEGPPQPHVGLGAEHDVAGEGEGLGGVRS